MNGHFLTPRELEIFKLLIKNETTKTIASKLHISDKTVRNHISNVIGKLGVTSRTQAIIMLAKSGMIEIQSFHFLFYKFFVSGNTKDDKEKGKHDRI